MYLWLLYGVIVVKYKLVISVIYFCEIGMGIFCDF